MSGSALPVRQIYRLVLEMQLSCCGATHRVLQAQTGRQVSLNRAAYLLLVLRCNRRLHTSSAGAASRPGSAVDGISVSAIAASFDQPFETARRHANELIEQGFCVRQGLRICIRRQQFDTPPFKQYLIELHDVMVRFVQQLRDAGVTLPGTREARIYDRNATTAAALDLTLAAYEYGAPFFSSWLEMHVMSAVVCGNARPLTVDPDLSRRYTHHETVPPDDLLHPVSARAIARVLNISEATARRQVRIALDRGLVARKCDGVIRTKKALETPSLITLPGRASIRALRTIQRLGASGFRFDDPASHYINGAPPLANFD